MFCEKCGKQIPDNSAFCDGCGAPVAPAEAQPQEPQQTVQEEVPVTANQPQAEPAKQFKMPSKVSEYINKLFPKPFVLTKQLIMLGSAVLAALAIIITVICVVVAFSNNVDMGDYFTVKDEGFNKYGSVEYEISYEKLVSEITGKDVSGSDINSWADIYSAATSASAMQDIRGAINVDIAYPGDKEDGALSNGDVVKFNLVFDQKVAAKYDVDVESVTIEHKIEKLGEAQVFNVMEKVGVTFEGYNGAGRASLSKEGFTKTVGSMTFTQDGEYPDYIRYSNDDTSGSIYIYIDGETSGLSNGDKVKTSVDGGDKNMLSKYGIILDGLTKEYTVEGLSESETYDVMANFEIKTYGVDGEGKASIVAKDSSVTVGDITFTTSEDEEDVIRYEKEDDYYGSGSIYLYFEGDHDDLSNGDTVKIEANVEADRLGDYGVILTNLTKEITVEGLGKYMAKLADATEESKTTLAGECKEDLKNRLYDDWADVVHDDWWDDYDDQVIGDDMKLHKIVLTTPKNTDSSDKNTLWVVISVTLKDDSMDEDTLYYFYYAFDDIAVDTKGNLSYSDEDVTKSYGYTDYDEMYDDCIEAYNLNIETSK